MRIIDVQQGTPEWIACKCGVPSASNFDKIITIKGEPSKQGQKYMYQLAGEKVSGLVEESYQNAAMLRGIELESEARQLYQLMNGVEVKQVGFCVIEGLYVYGASPDGLVGKPGALEIKCPTPAVHVGYLLNNALPLDYFQQIQGQLLVTGCKWVDFMSYYPGLKPFIIRVQRDEKFLSLLLASLEVFCTNLKEVIYKIK